MDPNTSYGTTIHQEITTPKTTPLHDFIHDQQEVDYLLLEESWRALTLCSLGLLALVVTTVCDDECEQSHVTTSASNRSPAPTLSGTLLQCPCEDPCEFQNFRTEIVQRRWRHPQCRGLAIVDDHAPTLQLFVNRLAGLGVLELQGEHGASAVWVRGGDDRERGRFGEQGLEEAGKNPLPRDAGGNGDLCSVCYSGENYKQSCGKN